MPINQTPGLSLRVGLPVLLLNGETVGSISGLAPTSFRLQIGGRELWLANDAIFTADEFKATLACEVDGLERYSASEALR